MATQGTPPRKRLRRVAEADQAGLTTVTYVWANAAVGLHPVVNTRSSGGILFGPGTLLSACSRG